MSSFVVEIMFFSSFKLSRISGIELNSQTLLMLSNLSMYIEIAKLNPNFHASLYPLPTLCNFVMSCHSESRPLDSGMLVNVYTEA